MEHIPTVQVQQYTMFPMVRSFKYKYQWNPYKKNGTLLWYNPTINNIYLDGSEIISTFHRFKDVDTLNESFAKHAKEEY